MQRCARKKCTTGTDRISGYCSDVCLQLDQDFDAPPVTVLARNKAGGVGTGLEWQVPQPVHVRHST
ncbi:hypothetical protein GCM10022295_85790 [Streptomyces osmaniensis]|uniref:Uncharacterized protein n=1 Tax=Streptomyces osmaniensis TaxID=593134 RepID=A0ABP6YUJ0_9ACTN